MKHIYQILSYNNGVQIPSEIVWQGSSNGATEWTDLHTSINH